LRRRLVAAEAELIKAGGAATEIDHHEKEGRERIQPKMGAEPGKPDWQDQSLGRGLAKQSAQAHHKTNAAKSERSSVDQDAAEGCAMEQKRQCGNDEKDGDSGENDGERHRLTHL